jgi:hypothetical protein
MEEKIKKMFEVAEVVRVEYYFFHREENGEYTFYDGGTRLERMSKEAAAEMALRIIEILKVKFVSCTFLTGVLE